MRQLLLPPLSRLLKNTHLEYNVSVLDWVIPNDSGNTVQITTYHYHHDSSNENEAVRAVILKSHF